MIEMGRITHGALDVARASLLIYVSRRIRKNERGLLILVVKRIARQRVIDIAVAGVADVMQFVAC